MPVKILTDSTCDYCEELKAQYDVGVIPLYVTVGEKSYRDGMEISAEDLAVLFEEKKTIAKTSASSVGDFIDFFRPYVQAGMDIVYIGLSATLSSQMVNAKLASEEFPERKICCVSSESLSVGISLLVLEAVRMAEEGMTAEQIAAEIESMREKVHTSFVVSSFDYLHRGGRCSGLERLGAAMLSLKLGVRMTEGKMHPAEKYRGNLQRVIFKYVDNLLEDQHEVRPQRAIAVFTNELPQKFVDEVVEYIRSKEIFEEVLSARAGCVIFSHCGPGSFGLMFCSR